MAETRTTIVPRAAGDEARQFLVHGLRPERGVFRLHGLSEAFGDVSGGSGDAASTLLEPIRDFFGNDLGMFLSTFFKIHLIEKSTYDIQHTACSIQHTACSIQHAAYSIQHTACSIQHTAYSTAYSIQQTACSIQHTA